MAGNEPWEVRHGDCAGGGGGGSISPTTESEMAGGAEPEKEAEVELLSYEIDCNNETF